VLAAVLYFSSLSPSPERIAEAFEEPLLENKHSVSAEMHHASWAATRVIVVVATQDERMRLLHSSRFPFETKREGPARVTWQGQLHASFEVLQLSEMGTRCFRQNKQNNLSKYSCFYCLQRLSYFSTEPLPRKVRRSFSITAA
jgi:hypothetical protein